MTWWEACILGVVEGLTEYLPVSSTGHLILAERVLGMPKTAASDAYAIAIQGGAILAVLGLYWRRVQQMLAGWLGKVGIGQGDATGFNLSLCVVVAFLPAVVVGLKFKKAIDEHLFGLWPITFAWLVGGIAILAVCWNRKRTGKSITGKPLESLTWKAALIIGLIQCIAMWPGTSRSLVTIVGGILVGLSVPAAVEFSFLLGVLTLLAATAKESLDHGKLMLESFGPVAILTGAIAAWVSAFVAVKWMVSYLQRRGMEVFGYYRVALAVLVALALWQGWLNAR